MNKAEITHEEWLADLERLDLAKDSDGMTTDEIAEATGLSRRRVQQQLKIAHESGILKVTKRRYVRYDGETNWQKCYRIVKRNK